MKKGNILLSDTFLMIDEKMTSERVKTKNIGFEIIKQVKQMFQTLLWLMFKFDILIISNYMRFKR